MNPSSLSDREMNEAIARAMGWGYCLSARAWHLPNDDRHTPVPDFATSLDALSEPEQRLRDAGLYLLITEDGLSNFTVEWVSDAVSVGVPSSAFATTEARARAEACLAALKAIPEARS